ncbi:hypothetical protein MF672_010645 [Actinomadura sp. ATCC 31491]|uniref:Uncharacterized protein n=1 Tax=Actinomadura luzonensis TaxID=2805427 RepID=A0ABT0FPN4_9ACTN|nr:hypothetical protein [Actinomadura luzonensis]MCK2214244.1 hypothetical protein [Actinomadura luzonensis]
MYVRFTPKPARLLPTGHVAASEHIGEGSFWQISTSEIDLRDPQVIQRLNDVGSDAASILSALPRETPGEPWGEIRFEEYDISPSEINWQMTESGFLIRVPTRLMTARLRRGIERIGTDQLRYFDPPDPAVWRKIESERRAARQEER